MELSPVWRFSDVDHDGVYSFSVMDTAKFVEFLGKLKSFESMKWKELLTGGQHCKRYEVDKMPAPSRKRLIELQLDDLDTLVRFRCSGPERLYGFLRGHVFHVLWWDPEHRVWPSMKKNT